MARLFFFACFTFTLTLIAGQSLKYELKGGKVVFNPSIVGHPDEILWKLNGNKVVEFNGQEQQVYHPYENRITLDWVSAELSITDLRFDDSGDYELEVDIKKKFQRSLHKLEVIDKVTKPTISCEMNNGSSLNTSAELECSSGPRQLHSLSEFKWKTHGNVQRGAKLTISLGDKHDDEVYICSVSNPLSNATATFTAKDCYPDRSSAAWSIIPVIFLIVSVVLAILFCKLRRKACFAKSDLEKQSPPGATEENSPLTTFSRATTLLSTQPLLQGHKEEADSDTVKGHVNNMKNIFEQTSPQTGSDKKKGENSPLSTFSRATTLPSTQPLLQGHKEDTVKVLENNTDGRHKTATSPSPPPSESPSPLDLNNLDSDDKDDPDAEQLREPAEEESPQYDLSHSEKANEPVPAEPEKEADEDEEAQSAPESSETSAAQPHLPVIINSPNMASKDTVGEQKEDTNSDQFSGETAENNVRECDSSDEQETNESASESDDSSEVKLSSAIPEQRGSKTSLHDLKLPQEETHTSKENQQEPVKSFSDDEEETDKEEDLYSDTTQQSQCRTPTKPDGPHADPDQQEECKTSTTSESEGRSAEHGGEAVEGKNDVNCGLKEEKPGDESVSEDKEER